MTVPTTRAVSASENLTCIHHPFPRQIRTRDEVQRQVHNVPDESLGAELLEGVLQNLSESLDGITSRLELTTLCHNSSGVSRHESAIKRIKKSVPKQEVAGYDGDQGGALAQDQEDGGEHGQRAIRQDHDGELGQIGEEEHAREHADGKCDGGTETRKKGLPQGTVGEEVKYTLGEAVSTC